MTSARPGPVVDALREALTGLYARFVLSGLPAVELPAGLRDRLSRRARVEETAELLRALGSA